MSKNKYFIDFKTFESKVNTDEWEPPIYLVKPAEGDKGFALVKAEFEKRKSYFIPGISSTNNPKDK